MRSGGRGERSRRKWQMSRAKSRIRVEREEDPEKVGGGGD